MDLPKKNKMFFGDFGGYISYFRLEFLYNVKWKSQMDSDLLNMGKYSGFEDFEIILEIQNEAESVQNRC